MLRSSGCYAHCALARLRRVAYTCRQRCHSASTCLSCSLKNPGVQGKSRIAPGGDMGDETGLARVEHGQMDREQQENTFIPTLSWGLIQRQGRSSCACYGFHIPGADNKYLMRLGRRLTLRRCLRQFFSLAAPRVSSPLSAFCGATALSSNK